jgi:hypothetical protein
MECRIWRLDDMRKWNLETNIGRNELHEYILNVASFHCVVSDELILSRFLKKLDKMFDQYVNHSMMADILDYKESLPKESNWNQAVLQIKFLNTLMKNSTVYVIRQKRVISMYAFDKSFSGSLSEEGEEFSKELKSSVICFERSGIIKGNRMKPNTSDLMLFENGNLLVPCTTTYSATEADLEIINQRFPLNGDCGKAAIDVFRNKQDTDFSELGKLFGFQIYLTADMSGYELESETERLRFFRHRAMK